MSPMQRSLALYRERGFEPWIVERWIKGAGKRVDLYGIGDFVALKPGEAPHLVQTTSANHYAEHWRKILGEKHLPLVLEHFRVFLHGWGPQKVKRGGKAVTYVLREAEFTPRDLELQTFEEALA